jgi:hypothetical protein
MCDGIIITQNYIYMIQRMATLEWLSHYDEVIEITLTLSTSVTCVSTDNHTH